MQLSYFLFYRTAVISPDILQVGKMLSEQEYQKQVVPCIVKMFSITDRQTRVKLLQQMNFYIEHIPVNIVNEQLYPNIALGFNDTNPLVRETTIKVHTLCLAYVSVLYKVVARDKMLIVCILLLKEL